MTTITFFSNATQHELVRQPKTDKPVPSGAGWMNDTPGIRYKFQPAVDETGRMVGRLDAQIGADVMEYEMQGWLAPGEPQGVRRDAVAALRAHKQIGKDFWEMATPAADLRSTIRRASVALDADALQALIDTERATFRRLDLISEAEDALKLVLETQAELKAAREAQEAEEFETPTVTPVEAPKPKAKAKPKAEPQV